MIKAEDFKLGDIVNHGIEQNRPMLVLATSSDGFVNCGYFDTNAICQTQWFFPQELERFQWKTEKSGFTKEA